MTRWAEALSKCLAEKHLVLSRQEDGGREVELAEKQANVDMKVTLSQVWEDCVVVNMAGVDHPDCVLPGDLRQKCDFLIFASTGEGRAVILIELKQTVTGESKPYEQLLRTRPIADYLVSLAERDAALGNSLSPKAALPLRFHYVLLGRKADDRLDKQRIRTGPAKSAWYEEFANESVLVFLDERIPAAELLRGAPGESRA